MLLKRLFYLKGWQNFFSRLFSKSSDCAIDTRRVGSPKKSFCFMTFAAEKEILDTIEVEAAKNGLTSREIQTDYGAIARSFEHDENILRFHRITNNGRSCLPDKPALRNEVKEEKIKNCILNLELKARQNYKTCCRYVSYVMIKHRFWDNSASFCLNKLKGILGNNAKEIIGSEKNFSDDFVFRYLADLQRQDRKSYNPYKEVVKDLEEELKAEGLM